ncbi:MAG: BamA/TamA family outer membrane protein [Muribaculaceae bacterium]|nr:BamA/TamA family outer membrane protein [Muribaculaceae bacterium]
MIKHAAKILAFLSLMAIFAACSTTSKLAEGEVLYTGVKSIKYNQSVGVKIDTDVKDIILTAVDVKPNNPLYSPYIRSPFPIGLWVYNHWDENSKGLKGWLYKKLVAKPVLISRVRPETRVNMINDLLKNNGYFDSNSSYSLNYSGNNKKKAKITYEINVRPPYTLGDITYINEDTPITNLIDSVARTNEYFQTGSRYCLDSLNNVRIDIANQLRNRGYYFFRPEYIEYLADSVTQKGVINMQLVKSANIPNQAYTKYLANDITVRVDDEVIGGTSDTVVMKYCTIIKKQPVHISDNLINSCIRGRKGRPFRVGNMDLIQMYLARTGIFSNINIQAIPLDTLLDNGYGLIDLDISCTLDKPIEVKVEARATTKTTSFIGPGIGLGIKHKNIFGGAEQLSADLTASYEWQTGKGNAYKNSDFNSYEVGLDIGLSIPRLIAPRFIDRARRYTNWTKFSIGGDFLNRPNYFKMARVSAEMTWEWHSRKYSQHKFTPLKLTYSNLLSTTEAFDSIYFTNRAIEQSFQDVFIPQMSYTYTLDRTHGKNNFVWSTTVTEAGNLCYLIWKACGVDRGDMHILNTYFSQFIKAHTQFVWTRALFGEHKIVGRMFVGAAYAYGNAYEVPYMEQFYIGGSNSLRGFAVRTVGPGSYRPKVLDRNAYYDQTGTFKFEANMEYRVPLVGYLKGALFVDAGNVWLLKDDAFRPGGKLEGKNFFKELALNTGFGLRFDMEMIVLRADLGIALHAPYDTGKKGYFNIPKFGDGLALHFAIGYPF